MTMFLKTIILKIPLKFYYRYVETVCGTLKLILETFGPLLKSCLNPAAGIGVDITAEERYRLILLPLCIL